MFVKYVGNPNKSTGTNNVNHHQFENVSNVVIYKRLQDNHYGKAPLKKKVQMKHPFCLASHTCYHTEIPFPNRGNNWIMHKAVGLIIH